ncbi:hypothetical protein C8034_v002040 [Colletotrichum sidae]|uniref:DUF7791 domain-containing protein n=1 Tax=Colletotrichum sidae TaxID=1347389 RepID=A0A4R8TC50_9PEZI|nr:hypothetical protein C8034_v002040 [Colletotrichum sidae]
MTPLEIIGLVSAVITFIDFAAENVAVLREVGTSGSATVKGNKDLTRRIKLLDERVSDIHLRGPGSARDIHEARLLNLVDEYKDLTVKLLSLLDGLKSTRKRDVLWKSVKNMLKKEERDAFVQDLDNCRSRIHLQLTQVMRNDFDRSLNEIGSQGHQSLRELRELRSSAEALELKINNNLKHIPEFVEQLRQTVEKSVAPLIGDIQRQVLKEVGIDGMENRFEEWKQAVDGSLLKITAGDVDKALETVLMQPKFVSEHKIAFFIDGLDEFDGDHHQMMKVLLDWAKLHGDNMKLCVSSREWEIFRQRLMSCPKIKLQDITRRDIKSYVNQELSENEDFVDYALTNPRVLSLVEKLTEKAEGVFLWVKITLRGLKYDLLSGEEFSSLEERIEALPTKLEELYQSILEDIQNGPHITKTDRIQAMRTLFLVSFATGRNNPLLLIHYSFLSDYNRDGDFALHLPIRSSPLSNIDLNTRMDRGRKLIYQRCLGLVETFEEDVSKKGRLWREGLDVQRLGSKPQNDKSRADQMSEPDSFEIEIGHKSDELLRDFVEHGYSSPDPIQDGEEEEHLYNRQMGARHFHKRTRLLDFRKVNFLFPMHEGVRYIHTTVHEFFLQEHNQKLIETGSLGFNLAAFSMEAFLASIKFFRPSIRYTRRKLSWDLRHTFRNIHSKMGEVSGERFMKFIKEG